MSVTFDEEQQLVKVPQAGVSGLYGLVIRWGFAKDEKGATTVLLIAAGVMIVFVIGLWVTSPRASTGPTHEELIRMQPPQGV